MLAQIRVLFCLFLIYLTTCGFAIDVPDWADLFQNQKAVGFELPLGKGKGFFIKIPSGFHYGYSKDTEQGTILEFIPNGETVENWTQIHTIILLPHPVKNFENFVKEFSGPHFPVYREHLAFNKFDQVDGFCYFWEAGAIKFPEYSRIEGVDESTLKFGFQGDEGFYILAHCIRYSDNELQDQKERRIEGAFDLLDNSYEIIEY